MNPPTNNDPNGNDPGITADSSYKDIALSMFEYTKTNPEYKDAVMVCTAAELRDRFHGTTLSRLYRDVTDENVERVRNKLCRAINEARRLVLLEEVKEKRQRQQQQLSAVAQARKGKKSNPA